MTELAWGTTLTPEDGDRPGGEFTRQLDAACAEHPDFQVVEWRRVALPGRATADYLIVDARAGVPGRNAVGIHAVERLALGERADLPWRLDVRALRTDFPEVMHLNLAEPGEPESLCLYAEDWASVERSWTPRRHLDRIVWWLKQTALGTLHAADQPLEPLFYGHGLRVILPRAMQDAARNASVTVSLQAVALQHPRFQMWRARAIDTAPAGTAAIPTDCILFDVPPADSDYIRHFPQNLSALDEAFEAMGSELLGPMRDSIRSRIGPGGLERFDDSCGRVTLLIVRIPRLRDGVHDSFDVRAFLVGCELGRLGEACEALLLDRVKWRMFVIAEIGNARKDNADQTKKAREACRGFVVEPVDVLFELDIERAQLYSGVDSATADFTGVLIGVGALGGLLADIWAREGWGRWNFVDEDVLLPHNVVRHIGRNADLGAPKAHIVRASSGFLDPAEPTRGAAYTVAYSLPLVGPVASLVTGADLVVDVSTTLYVGRDAIHDTGSARMACVFLTPTGLSSVLLLDSADRSIRVGHLEPQYYRAMLREEWGASHLSGVDGALRISGGCRDASLILSNELIHLHGGLLARQLRCRRAAADAGMCVWRLNDASGALEASELGIDKPIEEMRGSWRVLWDEGIKARMFELRDAHLPSETGGILLGYVDQKLKTVFVVDALEAPPDSKADATGFTRGTVGVAESIKRSEGRTADIVSYIGEWHSHPKGQPPTPSELDELLLDHFFKLRATEHLPTAMIIAGHNNETSVSLAA